VSVVVFGSANMDLTVRVPRSPRAGETITGSAFELGLGGKGVNQAVAAARCGARTSFLGRVGDDAYGDAVREGLVAAGIDVDGLMRDATAATGVAIVVLSASGDNRIVVVPGANGAVDESDLARLDECLDRGGLLLLQLELPLAIVVAAIAATEDRGVRVLLDPAPVPLGGLSSAAYAPHVILTPNESEAAALVGHSVESDEAAERAASTLLRRGLGGVVLKLGPRGICWTDGQGVRWQAAFPAEVVDTVGAGDAVNGALAAALDEGALLGEAVRWAAAAGAVAVSRAGAYAAMPTRQDVMSCL